MGGGIADGCGARREAFREAVLGGQRPVMEEETSGRGQSILVWQPGLSWRCVSLGVTGQATSWTGKSVRDQRKSGCHRVALPIAGCLNLPKGNSRQALGAATHTTSQKKVFEHVGFDSNCDVALEITTTTKSLQSCPTLCDPMDFSLPGFSVHGILQARTLEWVAISFSNV